MNLFLQAFIIGSLVLSILLTIQSAYTLYLMLYTWDRPDAYKRAKAPAQFLPPQKSFTVMLPARHEEDVIQTTIERVVSANYPKELLEVVVICKTDDEGTISKAEEKILSLRAEGVTNVRVLTFSTPPTNKPHGLNVGLRETSNEVVTIFDSEDDIHPDIFNVINTVMLQESVNVVQSGVQLMNYETNWYSTLNVLEYFFWFKSRLHYHARAGMTPLGGNTVFFARHVLVAAGGWVPPPHRATDAGGQQRAAGAERHRRRAALGTGGGEGRHDSAGGRAPHPHRAVAVGGGQQPLEHCFV